MADDMSSSMEDNRSDQPHMLSHEILKKITNNFDEALIVGRGGFGTVYKGMFENGKEIAVKVLDSMSVIDSTEFQKEFENLRRLKHHNVVELVGFCNESDKVDGEFNGEKVIAEDIHMALCFEFVPNGDLAKHISADECSGLDWRKRYKIIKGVCEGLEYLQHGLELSLWHLDLKPSNILLDNDMIPKIADFGLSRLLLDEKTRKTTDRRGTCGYMPPEYIEFGIITKKFDIFSLGVLIAKLMAGREGYSEFADAAGDIFVNHVRDNWRKRLCKRLPRGPLEVYCHQVTKCIQIAVQCMKRDRKERPSIKSILSDLRETEIKICNLGLQTEQFWDEEGINDRPPEMAADASRGKADKSVLSTLPKQFPLDFLRTITDQFSDERIISHNEFGTLYKGILPDGEVIMVKKLAENTLVSRDKEFTAEVKNIIAIHHENVVRLIGYCHESQKKVVQHNGRYIVADVFESLLCYEYLPKGSLQKNLFEVPSIMDWGTRFEIIRGICQGLRFLHSTPIVHMDLKSENILLDNNMRPKIANFSLSRVFGQEQTHMYTENVVGSHGYIAPEYLYRGEISIKLDIYSLGLLILETTTQEKNVIDKNDPSSRTFIEHVGQKWTPEHIALSCRSSQTLQQVKVCIGIGLECVNIGRCRRPSIEEIVDVLDGRCRRRSDILISRSLPSLQPRWTNFPIESKRMTSSSLYLSNNTHDRIVFRLVTDIPKRYHTKLPFCGIVPPNCTYTLVVIMRRERKSAPSNNDNFLTLQSSIAHHEDLDNVDPASVAVFLDSAGDEVKEVKVALAYETAISNQIIDSSNYREVLSVDVHPTDPWILISNQRGSVCIWNYQKQVEVKSIEVTTTAPVYSAKFIERQEWFVAGSGDGCIYVYNYNTMEEVDIIEAHDSHRVMCLAVNPTHSFVLSASDDHTIKLWDWTNEWQCTRTFEGHNGTVTQVMFDLRNSESFASASLDHKVKFWNIHSGTCNTTWDGHPDGLLFVHYYTPWYSKQFLVSGSSDGAAKIWDLETDSCVDMLQEHEKGLSALCWHPELQVLVTGSLDGTVRIWNWKSSISEYRLGNIIGLNLGAVHALGYLKGLPRIVVGCDQGIALMEINVL